jgi:MSHA biogenesis protein MshE
MNKGLTMSETTNQPSLGAMLVTQGFLLPEHLADALTKQKRSGQLLGRILVDNNYTTEEQISQTIAQQLQLTYIDLRRFEVQPQVVQLLSELQARRFRALVLEDRGNSCLLGVVDPSDLRSQDEVAVVLRRHVSLAVITNQQLLQTIDRVYRKTEQMGEFARAVEREVGDHDKVIDLGAIGHSIDDAEAPVVKLLQTIFDDAARVNASDIHFEPQETILVVRFRIDGVLHIQVQADLSIASMLIVRLKLMAALDIAERRLPQDGRMAIRSGESRFDIRMSTMPTQFGESVVLRLLRQDAVRKGLRQMMPARVCDIFERVIGAPHGMVLVTGPTGSGKTTTLYAALTQLNQPSVKILTCEDPVEYHIAGISQVQINEKIGLSFARVLRSFLRQDPDILLVGEIRDDETADIAVRAAMTGHLVLSTLHTNDARSTPLRLLDMAVPGYMIASTLLAVLSQRLLRKVCSYCAQPATPTPEELAWFTYHAPEHALGQAAPPQFMQGRGCARCNGVGYSGRRGVFEIIEMTAPLAQALQSQDPGVFDRLALAQMGSNTLVRNALDMVLAGETTLAEAMTVSA